MSERDWADVPYVRVYYSIVTDTKFETVYGDDAALAAWLRLLIGADATYPMPAPLPAAVARKALRVLTDASLVIVTGNHYRITGLDKERAHRFNGGKGRPRYPSDGAPKSEPGPESTRSESESVGVESESPRNHSESHARAGASASVSGYVSSSEGGAGGNRPPVMAVIDYLEQRTGRQYAFGSGSKVHECLSPDVRDFGAEAVIAAMRADPAEHPDIGQLVFGASRRLHPVNGAEKPAEPDPEYVAQQLALRREERRKARAADAH